MMREALFEAIKSAMDHTEVEHIDFWNHNLDFLEREDTWPMPALFVEFGAISWEAVTNGIVTGTGEVRLHLVTDWNEGGYEAAFALSREVSDCVWNLSGNFFKLLRPLRTETDHKHEEILDTIDTYSVRYSRYGGWPT